MNVSSLFDQLKCIITEEHWDVVLGDYNQGPGVESAAGAQEGGSAPCVGQPVMVWLPDLQGAVNKHESFQARVTHLVTVITSHTSPEEPLLSLAHHTQQQSNKFYFMTGSSVSSFSS